MCEAWVSPGDYIHLLASFWCELVFFFLACEYFNDFVHSTPNCVSKKIERLHKNVFFGFVHIQRTMHNAHTNTQWISSHHRYLHSCYLFIFLCFRFKYELIDTFHASIFSHLFSSVCFFSFDLIHSFTLSMCVSHPTYDEQELVIILKSISPGGKSVHFGGWKKKRKTKQNESNRAHTHTHTLTVIM